MGEKIVPLKRRNISQWEKVSQQEEILSNGEQSFLKPFLVKLKSF